MYVVSCCQPVQSINLNTVSLRIYVFLYCTELRRATIPIFFDMMQYEFMIKPYGGHSQHINANFHIVSTEAILSTSMRHVVPCRAMPCCTVLCHAALCHAAHFCDVPRCAVPRRAELCRAMPHCAVPCHIVPCRPFMCRTALFRATQCRTVPCRTVPCRAARGR